MLALLTASYLLIPSPQPHEHSLVRELIEGRWRGCCLHNYYPDATASVNPDSTLCINSELNADPLPDSLPIASVHVARHAGYKWGPWDLMLEYGDEYLVVTNRAPDIASDDQVIDAYLTHVFDFEHPDGYADDPDELARLPLWIEGTKYHMWQHPDPHVRILWLGTAHNVAVLLALAILLRNLCFAPRWMRQAKLRHRESGHCHHRRYDLRGRTTTTCPECGHHVDQKPS